MRETLPRGNEFPFDFGFFPSTRGEDGDPLDALVLSDRGLAVGITVSTRLIVRGQEEGRSERNDCLIVVPTILVIYAKIKTLADLPKPLVEQIDAFFGQDACFKGKKRTLLGRCDARAALLQKGKAEFKRRAESGLRRDAR